MKSNTVRLGDIADICSGGTPSKKRDEYWKGSIPWVSAKSMDADWLNTNLLFISEEGLKAGSKLAPSNSILLLTRGSGLFNRIPVIWIAEPLAFNQDIKCITAKSPLDTRFIYHWLCSQREHLSKMLDVTGLGAGKINTDQLLSLEVFWPEYSVRRKIVTVADSIVEKMKLNQLLNDYLAELLLALQKQIAKTEELTESRADEVFNIHIGKTPPRKEPEWFSFDRDGNVIWMSIKDMGGGDAYLIDSSEYLTPEAVDKHNIKRCKPGSVLLSFKLTVGRVGIVASEMVTNEAIACFSSDDPRKLAYLYPLLKSYDYASLGSTSSIATAVNSKMIKAMGLEMPSSTVLDAFYERAKPIYELLLSNTREIAALNELRDTLLPKLMSGEIDVSKIDLTQLNNHLA